MEYNLSSSSVPNFGCHFPDSEHEEIPGIITIEAWQIGWHRGLTFIRVQALHTGKRRAFLPSATQKVRWYAGDWGRSDPYNQDPSIDLGTLEPLVLKEKQHVVYVRVITYSFEHIWRCTFRDWSKMKANGSELRASSFAWEEVVPERKCVRTLRWVSH